MDQVATRQRVPEGGPRPVEAVEIERFAVLDDEGAPVAGGVPELPPDRLVEVYRWMLLGRTFDQRMINLQRQGRSGTYGSIAGQEATLAGVGAAMRPTDWLIPSYREVLTCIMHGVPMQVLMRLYRGHVGKGIPPGCNCLPIQIVVGAQMPHATGVAMAFKLRGEDAVAVGCCGDGATSEGDFHEALNIAGVYRAPAVFVVQNNGWAISTPRERQTAAGSIAQKALGYGMPGYQVDGNDVLAVYAVMAEAIRRARAGGGPSLVEAVNYRFGAHTTADDPRRYRTDEELAAWQKRDPIPRFRKYLERLKLWSEELERRLADEVAAEVNAAVAEVEAMPPTDPTEMFDHVYAVPSATLLAQRGAVSGRL